MKDIAGNDTCCWNCSAWYQIRLHRCPQCGCANGNVNLDEATAEMKNHSIPARLLTDAAWAERGRFLFAMLSEQEIAGLPRDTPRGPEFADRTVLVLTDDCEVPIYLTGGGDRACLEAVDRAAAEWRELEWRRGLERAMKENK